jgi:hypothetical protein
MTTKSGTNSPFGVKLASFRMIMTPTVCLPGSGHIWHIRFLWCFGRGSDSRTIGIPLSSPEGYDIIAQYAEQQSKS